MSNNSFRNQFSDARRYHPTWVDVAVDVLALSLTPPWLVMIGCTMWQLGFYQISRLDSLEGKWMNQEVPEPIAAVLLLRSSFDKHPTG